LLVQRVSQISNEFGANFERGKALSIEMPKTSRKSSRPAGQGSLDHNIASRNYEKTVAGRIGDIAAVSLYSSENYNSGQEETSCHWLAEKEPRWMNEEDYRAAWKRNGFDVPADIWT
jgi:hypothetical protein